jgi:hypothetical protein
MYNSPFNPLSVRNKKLFFIPVFIFFAMISAKAQQAMKHEDTELYTPVPPVVTPGKSSDDPPSDAIILFDGKNLDKWVSTKDTTKPANWIVKDGILTVNKNDAHNIQTKELFMDYQIHLEWREPAEYAQIPGNKPDFYKSMKVGDTDKIYTGQARGNSGLFLASTGKGDDGYEMQILDNYNNSTYTNGQAGSIYKQHAPLVNPNRPPGEWQTYDVIWTAPRFNEDSTLKSPARVTAFFNGILVQNNVEVKGGTRYVGIPFYKKHGPSPIKLQAHGDKSKPISFRNILVRRL